MLTISLYGRVDREERSRVPGAYRSSTFAVTDRLRIVMLQDPVLLHAPDHPANVDPVAGLGTSVTTVPAVALPLHVTPQSMPGGSDVTVP